MESADILFLKRKEVISFIFDHIQSDINRLILSPPPDFKDRIRLIADQIHSRQKAIGKLDSWSQDKRLILPPPVSIEQASSETTATFKKELAGGDKLVDLTGGAGIDCLTLSENFNTTTYVEQNSGLCNLFRHNTKALGIPINVYEGSAEDFLSSAQEEVTYYMDPSRRDLSGKRVVKLEDCSPNINTLMPSLKVRGNGILLKVSPLLDLKKTLDDLNCVKNVYVISVKNDCKEILFSIDFSFNGEPNIQAVNLNTSNPTLTFLRSKETAMTPRLGSIATYLYEPNASILKAGAFKTVAHVYEIDKIATNTHLYTSTRRLKNFPGKTFRILKLDAKNHLDGYKGVLNVITRNHPQKAELLKKKFGLKDGGNHYLIGFRDTFNKPQLVLAERLN